MVSQNDDTNPRVDEIPAKTKFSCSLEGVHAAMSSLLVSLIYLRGFSNIERLENLEFCIVSQQATKRAIHLK